MVASTFPVALPFVFFEDAGIALFVSRIIAVTMLFLGGLALGRYAGYGSWRTGVLMAGLGALVVAAPSRWADEQRSISGHRRMRGLRSG